MRGYVYSAYILVAIFCMASIGFALENQEEVAEQSDSLPTYMIHRTSEPIRIDGKLDESAWFAAPCFSPFRFTWYESGAKEQTVVKMLWDDKNIYLAHVCQDAHITARHKNHDDPIPEDDCFEIMLMPDPQHEDCYFNIEWNLLGGYVDGLREEGPSGPRKPWEVEGLKIAGSFFGSLNKDRDQDRYWLVEVAIPLRNFSAYMPQLPPEPGSQWRINFNRHGGDTNMQYSQWSSGDTPQPSFHTPHRFGYVTFSETTSPFSP